MTLSIPASFTPGSSDVAPGGQIAHPDAIRHVERLQLKLYKVGDRAWSLVGNGLSNQSFVEGPDGLIVIDTGESVEEMQAALQLVRQECSAPIAAVIYTHFHYVAGTTALLAEADGDLPIFGHSGIEANLRRFGGEVGPRSSRGMVHQFGVSLPERGPDGLLSCGLGLFLRNPGHAPFTPGHIPANQTFDEITRTTIAGLEVEFFPAPSDSTDSVTVWFPSLGLCVNNLIWPALFNVFAIRGEEYRDPRVLLAGINQIAELGADYLVGTHGPPLEGKETIREAVIDYHDSIQFLWDQTVRGANLGLTTDELVEFVQLPERFQTSYLTQQLYGVAEHHVRQIYSGLFGWFDEDETRLMPLPQPERARRLIQGFGGKPQVRQQVDEALAAEDYRWALELAAWLVRCDENEFGRADGGDTEDRQRLAEVLRRIGHNTTSANIRNWCLTRALELEGSIDLSRFRVHRLRAAEVAARPPEYFIPVLRVLLDPRLAEGNEGEVAFDFGEGASGGLRIRSGVAVPTSGVGADATLHLNHEIWANLLGGKAGLSSLLEADQVRISGDVVKARQLLACFDLAGFRS